MEIEFIIKKIQLYRESLNNDILTLDINKNTEPAGYYGSRFGQDVEAKGTYVTDGHTTLPNYINGVAHLKNPLYVDITIETQIKYKYDLSEQYKAKGKVLTNKLMKLGYDAIITRYTDYNNEFGEIILFPNSEHTLYK